MNSERDKFLTKHVFGECYHEEVDCSNVCKLCKCWFNRLSVEYFRRDFSIWDTFGKLWTWAEKQDWFYGEYGFLRYMTSCSATDHINAFYVHPDLFADALYDFLKEQEK